MLLRDIIRIYTLLQKNNEKTNPTLTHIVLKSPKMSHFDFCAFSANFCLIKIDLSGNTV